MADGCGVAARMLVALSRIGIEPKYITTGEIRVSVIIKKPWRKLRPTPYTMSFLTDIHLRGKRRRQSVSRMLCRYAMHFALSRKPF